MWTLPVRRPLIVKRGHGQIMRYSSLDVRLIGKLHCSKAKETRMSDLKFTSSQKIKMAHGGVWHHSIMLFGKAVGCRNSVRAIYENVLRMMSSMGEHRLLDSSQVIQLWNGTE